MEHNSTFFVCVIAIWLVAAGVAVAFTVYTNNFNLEYGSTGIFSGGTLGSCITCHLTPSGATKNSRGTDLADKRPDFYSIEGWSSDGDGFTKVKKF